MFDERLLERIYNLESKSQTRIKGNSSLRINSIINYLKKLLNTHQGSVLIADDYGIPDISNVAGESFDDMTKRIERVIQQVVTKYESRLSNVRVNVISDKEDVLTIRFRIDAVLTHDKTTPIFLETIVNTEGRIDVA